MTFQDYEVGIEELFAQMANEENKLRIAVQTTESRTIKAIVADKGFVDKFRLKTQNLP